MPNFPEGSVEPLLLSPMLLKCTLLANNSNDAVFMPAGRRYNVQGDTVSLGAAMNTDWNIITKRDTGWEHAGKMLALWTGLHKYAFSGSFSK